MGRSPDAQMITTGPKIQDAKIQDAKIQDD